MGGSKQQEPQYLPPPPAPPAAQQAGEATEATLAARLKYDPQLYAQQVELQQKYGLPLAQAQFDVERAIGPQQKAFFESLFPSLIPFQQQVQQRMTSPFSLTAEQQAAQDAIRGRQSDRLAEAVRASANLGGTLFSGNRQLEESRAQQELSQAYASEDINRQMQNRQQALAEQAQLLQLLSPNVQLPSVGGFGSAAPSADTLFSALQQQRQPVLIPGQQGSPSPWWQLGGAAAGAGLTAAILA